MAYAVRQEAGQEARPGRRPRHGDLVPRDWNPACSVRIIFAMLYSIERRLRGFGGIPAHYHEGRDGADRPPPPDCKALKDGRVDAAVGLLDDMVADLERRGIGTEKKDGPK